MPRTTPTIKQHKHCHFIRSAICSLMWSNQIKTRLTRWSHCVTDSQKSDTLQITFHTPVCAIPQDWDAESSKVTIKMANIHWPLLGICTVCFVVPLCLSSEGLYSRSVPIMYEQPSCYQLTKHLRRPEQSATLLWETHIVIFPNSIYTDRRYMPQKWE